MILHKYKDLMEFKFGGYEEKEPKALLEVLENDPLGLLDTDDEALDIFALKNVSGAKAITKVMPEYIAKGEKYNLTKEEKELFESITKMLKNGTAKKAKQHSKAELKKGAIFVANGIVGMVRDDKLSH